MPYIAASNSQSDYDLLKEKHSISDKGSAGLSDNSSETLQASSVARQDPELSSMNSSEGGRSTPETTLGMELGSRQNSLDKYNVRASRTRASPVPSALSNSDYDIKELLSFPNESTHAYSYNPLSPNSLAVRLRILKRSLEIMIRNPSLLHEHGTDNHLRVRTPNGSKVEFSFSTSNSKDTPCRPELMKRFSQEGVASLSKSKLINASSAALTALVNSNGEGNVSITDPFQTRTRSIPSFQLGTPPPKKTNSASTPAVTRETGSSTASNSPRTSVDESVPSSDHETLSLYKANSNQSAEYLTNKSDLVSLLEILNETLENNRSEKASNLHMISLLNYNKLSLDVDHVGDGAVNVSNNKHEEALKKNLLESLAQPFFETFNPEVIPEEGGQSNPTDDDKLINDPLALSTTRSGPESNRILHTFVSGKNSSPQAIFTCLQQYPWQFRAANDLACLTFGISKNALRALTLLDLIHSDSRNFVLNKIMSTENQELVFTGEIVGIIQPGDSSSQLVWSSVWAKRKNGLIVCVFEKVPCDYMDVLLNLDDFSVENIVGGERLKLAKNKEASMESTVPTQGDYVPKKKSVKFTDEIHDIKVLSKSLAQLIDDVQTGKVFSKDDDLLPMSIRVSNNLNKVRYFTLNHLTYNIPCAVSSSIMESEMKVKIHSLPYQAGIFIINSKDFRLISFNKSISKNMFGLHASELLGKPITEIVPCFPELLDYIHLKYPHLDISLPKNKGLVLTEHFFRKIQAEISGGEESFYNSIGIDAVHRDGSVIKVDIQLRVMDLSNALLWITHSRDVVFENYTTNPSQLLMLKENEIALVGSGSSSEASSKRPSRKIHVDDFQALKDNLQLDGATVKSFDDISKEHEPSMEEPPDTPTDDKARKGSICDIGDLDEQLAAKLEIAKRYSQDKSQFVKNGNFKLDEDLILSLTSVSSQSDSTTTAPLKSNSGPTYVGQTEGANSENIFLTIPEQNIGSLKHIKKFSDFLVLQKMGEGAYGKVDLCMHKKEKYIVVIKLIFKERILVDTWVRDRKLGTIPSEIQIMAALNKKPHENILMLLDFFEDDDYYYIETPIHGTTGSIDLFDLIELKTNMTEHEAKLVFKQIVSGIKHLHDNGIVHRDIKDENIIVDNKGFIKLIDFGSAAYVKSGPFDVFVGTIDYAAPEVLGGEPYEGKPQDIWALGVLLYTIIFKENPFYNIDEILDGDLRISSSSGVSDDCLALIQKILNRSIPKRPSIDDITGDKWLEV